MNGEHTPFARALLPGLDLPLLLASSSPRRRELLTRLGLAIDIEAPGVDETVLPGEAAIDHASRLARAKAVAVGERHPGRFVVAADTVVVTALGILGKPESEGDARRMLRILSGATHEVVTAVAAARFPERSAAGRVVAVSAHETTKVTFRPLGASEIEAYLATEEPYDKAGAYGAQGQGAAFIARIEGCYFNVVGLPVVRLLEVLRRALGTSLT
jgi:septum formation protein